MENYSIVCRGFYNFETQEMSWENFIEQTGERLGGEVFNCGSANLAAFIAISQAVIWCDMFNVTLPIVSNSETAIWWIRNKRMGSKVSRNCDEKLNSTINKCLKYIENKKEKIDIEWKKLNTLKK